MYKNEKKEGKEEGRKEGNKKNKKEGRKEFSGMYFSEKICNDCSIAGKLQSWFGSETRKSEVFIVIKDILGFW